VYLVAKPHLHSLNQQRQRAQVPPAVAAPLVKRGLLQAS
jgi:hypothetical protein